MLNMAESNSLEDSSHELIAVNEQLCASNSSESCTDLCDSNICQAEVRVTPKDGLHMVPCSLIVKLAQTFDCEIEIVKNGKTANAKAIFDLLGLMAEHNTTLLIVANGKMADVAVQQLTKLFSDNFRIN